MRARIPEFLFAGVVSLLGAGCIPTLPLRHLSVEAEPTIVLASGLQFGDARAAPPPPPTTLKELLDIAAVHHPDMAAARARVESARGRMIQEGLYPNPSIGPNFSQLGDSRNRLGEAGARLNQTIIPLKKFRLAKESAARGVDVADFQAVTKWHDVVSRVRFAYFELLTAQREEGALADIVRVSKEAKDTAKTLYDKGRGALPDVVRATVEFEQNQLRQEVCRARVNAARENLLTALGRPAGALDQVKFERHELDLPPPDLEFARMVACLQESSAELHEARAVVLQQEKLLDKAKADVMPNVSVTAVPFYESVNRELRTQIIVTAPIPIFDRNQGNIHAARADLAHALAAERQTELRLTERLTGAFQRYQSAKKQTSAYQNVIVPKAQESLDLVKAGYDKGDQKSDYTALLQAQQVLFQAKLAQTQALGELWRSVVEIAWILQQDDLYSGCGRSTK